MANQTKKFKLKKFNNEISVTRLANIHYFEFTNEYFTHRDSHPFRELVYVDSGSIFVDSMGYRGKLNSKQFLIHKENEEHSLSCLGEEAPNVIIIGFECDCDKLDAFSTTPNTLSNELVKTLTEIVKEGRSVFLPPYDVPNVKNMRKKSDYPFGADQMIRLKLEVLLIELIRGVSIENTHNQEVFYNKKIKEIYDYLSINFTEKITLDDLCFLFGTNKTTLCKNFKSEYGDSVINYVNKLRIKNAKKLMREGDLNLTELSYKLGFSSIHYFSKLFKFYENKSPTEYISSIKSKLDTY